MDRVENTASKKEKETYLGPPAVATAAVGGWGGSGLTHRGSGGCVIGQV